MNLIEITPQPQIYRAPTHNQDSECTVDLNTLLCIECGVDHSDQCPDCKGRGFHLESCYWMRVL